MTTAAPTPAEVHVTPERIMQFAWGYSIPLVLEAAIRHRVFDVLDSGPMNLDALAQATGASRRGLTAIVNVLVGLDFLSKDAQENFALTAESSAFLVTTKPSFMGGIIRHTSEQLLPSWLKLNEVVATGKPVHSVNEEKQGGEFFHDFVLDIFPMSYAPAQALAAHMDYASAGPVSVLDLAAGSGVWGIAQAQAGPQVRVTALDWPEVIDITKKTVAKFGLSDRYTFVEGDLASADFGSGHNLATLGHILHSEGAARSRALLDKVFARARSRRHHRHPGVPRQRRPHRPPQRPHLRRQHAGEHRRRRHLLLRRDQLVAHRSRLRRPPHPRRPRPVAAHPRYQTLTTGNLDSPRPSRAPSCRLFSGDRVGDHERVPRRGTSLLVPNEANRICGLQPLRLPG